MNKQNYLIARSLIRANGFRYGIRNCALDMYDKSLMIELKNQCADILSMRVRLERNTKIRMKLVPLSSVIPAGLFA